MGEKFDILSCSPAILRGVGKKRANLFEQIGIKNLSDLLYFFPRKYLTRANISSIRDARVGKNITLLAKIKKVVSRKTRKRFVEVSIFDPTGEMRVVFFNLPVWALRNLKPGPDYIFWGTVTEFQKRPQLVNPEFEQISDTFVERKIIPIYPYRGRLSKAKLSQKGFNKIIGEAIELAGQTLWDPIPEKIRQELRLPPIAEALRMTHFPLSLADVELARKRFAFEELFLTQLLFLKRRLENQSIKKTRIAFKGELIKSYLENLPFSLTSAQERVFNEIKEDIFSGKRMARLVEGDVGCGKTTVAMLAALMVIEGSGQVAFMAPTEILAIQHFERNKPALEKLGIKTALIKGTMSAKEKRKTLEETESGEIQLLFGTHALISEAVRFKSLELCIIDEQHRFGVGERLKLMEKSEFAHILLLSATPIPRTLFLGLYGDLDLSTIEELPPRKARVRTFIRTPAHREAIYKFALERFKAGEKGYFVFPSIGESEDDNGSRRISLTDGLKMISSYFPRDSIRIIHGKLKANEKEKAFKDFSEGRVSALVATSIVELGLDISSATILVVEGPEFFGLSQLHQLRGRIGRGKQDGYCILIASKPEDPESMDRLARFARTENGFELASLDLEIRGWGNPWGAEQHGFLSFRVAHPLKDKTLLELARKYAEDVEYGKIIIKELEMENLNKYLISILEKQPLQKLCP